MGLRRRELLQIGGLAALIPALDACGASLLAALQRFYVAGLAAGAVKG